jgi:hypothetical protein
MNLEIRWSQPLPLMDGDDVNLIYTVPGIDEWEEYPGVYMFCRIYNGVLSPLYIGRTKNIAKRIHQHLDTTKMMKEIQNSLNGEKVLIIGVLIKKPGQDEDASLKLVEKALINHALTEGYELINKAGTNPPYHSIQFNGYSVAKAFSGATMYARKLANG